MDRVFGVFQRTACFGLAAMCLILAIGIGGAFAQSGDAKAQQDQSQKAASSDAAKDGQRKVDEYAEAAKAINGPAGNPECVWLGRRVVSLMWRDDLDTAFRHLDLYDRFGCTGGHVQAAFRCLTRFGAQIDFECTCSSFTGAVSLRGSCQSAIGAGTAPADQQHCRDCGGSLRQ